MLNVTARQDLMSKIIETLGVVVEDARFDFSENGLEVRVVDPSHVAMIQMNIDAAAFETWELDETKLGLELRKIKELVSLGGPTDMIEMAYGDETGVLTVNLGKIDRNIRPLDNSTLTPPTLPELKLPCKVTISGADFTQALRAARQVGDLVNFSIDANTFTVHVLGSTDSVTVAFDNICRAAVIACSSSRGLTSVGSSGPPVTPHSTRVDSSMNGVGAARMDARSVFVSSQNLSTH